MTENTSSMESWLYQKWQITPQNIVKYKMAVTTKQYQVLEFFGDSVLDFIVSEYLVSHFTIDQPGWFTQMRSELVEEKNLARLAHSLGIDQIAIIPSTSHQEHITDSVMADMLEALLGALYLDQGIEKTKEVIWELFSLHELVAPSKKEEPEEEIVSWVSYLQEFLAKKGMSPPYYSFQESATQGEGPEFIAAASCEILDQVVAVEGRGSSKKEAKNQAAHKLYPLVKEELGKLRLTR